MDRAKVIEAIKLLQLAVDGENNDKIEFDFTGLN